MIAVEVKLPIVPRSDLCLIEMDTEDEVLASGIVMVKGKEARTGVVRAIGPGALSDNLPFPHRMPIGVEVGQHVHLQSSNCGWEFDARDGKRYVLVPQLAILGVLPT